MFPVWVSRLQTDSDFLLEQISIAPTYPCDINGIIPGSKMCFEDVIHLALNERMEMAIQRSYG